MRRLRDDDHLAWLELGDRVNVTGVDRAGWDATIWIAHAMYETGDLPGGLTHDEVRRIEEAASPAADEWPALDAILERAELVGSPLGRSQWPGAGWRRLTWRELGRRLGIAPFPRRRPPDAGSWPPGSWPANIQPPAEGSLDREQFVRLIDHLAACTLGGPAAPCVASYAMLAADAFDGPVGYAGRLEELVELYDAEDEVAGSPSNLWPDDRSWFVWTDWDLWATKVSGSADLIARLAADPELETVVLLV